MSNIIGSIFPVPKQFISRFFKENKNIFVKFLSGESTKLSVKQKIILYESYGSQKLIGEGVIEKIEFLLPIEVYKKYGNDLFLNKNELFDYAGIRKSKKMLTIKLNNIRKYDIPVSFPKSITIAGLYINEEQYGYILKHSSIKRS